MENWTVHVDDDGRMHYSEFSQDFVDRHVTNKTTITNALVLSCGALSLFVALVYSLYLIDKHCSEHVSSDCTVISVPEPWINSHQTQSK
jgi:hypothetical protein